MELNLLDMLQLAYKLAGNSAYGLIGSSTFIFGMTELSRACTAMGVETIKYVIEAIRTKSNITAVVKNDSLFIESYC